MTSCIAVWGSGARVDLAKVDGTVTITGAARSGALASVMPTHGVLDVVHAGTRVEGCVTCFGCDRVSRRIVCY
jgi:hypothetical protein